jgi:hypothetical protein
MNVLLLLLLLLLLRCCCRQLLHNRTGAQDYDAAALLLDHAANLLLPKLQYLSGPNICSCLAALAR